MSENYISFFENKIDFTIYDYLMFMDQVRILKLIIKEW